MGIDPDTQAKETPLKTHRETLGSDNITFVDALNNQISDVVEHTSSLKYDYILGDVSDYGVSGNGHAHFDLVHEDSKIHCVIYAFRLQSMDVTVEDGALAAVKGDLSYYEANGSVSLIVEDLVEVGEGNYQQTYQENKRLLEEDGLLDEETKQPLPEFPRRWNRHQCGQRCPKGCGDEYPQSASRRRYCHPTHDRPRRERDVIDDAGDQRTRR